MSKTVQSHVLKEFNLLKQMGSGAYGHVWHVQQKKTKKEFALKKVFDAFRNSIDAQRTYRQVQILKKLDHQNIIKLLRVMKSKNKKDLYLLFQFMQADLHSIVGSNILQKMHQIYIFYQILKALKYLHSAQLIHRDLKPSNILLNSECLVKICDFGLIRSLNTEFDQENILSEEVATKWYRAPQLLLGSRSYKKPIDMWSFGCIVAEILTGKPMFSGDSTLSQLQKIIQFTGKLSQQDIYSLDSPVADQLVQQIKVKKKQFRQYFSSIDKDFYQLIKGTLEFNPNKRLTVQQALNLPLFSQFQNQKYKLKTCQKPIKPLMDDNIRFGLKIYRQKIYEQIDEQTKNANLLRQNDKKQQFRHCSEEQMKDFIKPERSKSKKNAQKTKENIFQKVNQKRAKSESIKKRIQSHGKICQTDNLKKGLLSYSNFNNKKLNNSFFLKNQIRKYKSQSLKPFSVYKGKNNLKANGDFHLKNNVQAKSTVIINPYGAYLQSCKNKLKQKHNLKPKQSLVNIKNYYKSCQFIKCSHKQKNSKNKEHNTDNHFFQKDQSNQMIKNKHENWHSNINNKGFYKKEKKQFDKKEQSKQGFNKTKALKKKFINKKNILKNIEFEESKEQQIKL